MDTDMTPREQRRYFERVPTAARLLQAMGNDADMVKARRARKVLRGELDPREASEACDRWVRQCYNDPSWREQVMCAVNDLLGGHGVEAIENGNGRCIAEYVNTGDTYALTLLHNYQTGTVYLTSWGDFVEQYERRHGRLP